MNLQEIRGRLDKSDRDQWYDAHEMAEALEFAGVDASTIKDDAEFIAHAPTDVARLLNAIEAVEGLHKPDTVFTGMCAECSDFGSDDYPAGIQVPYPCPTVRAIESALEAKP